MKTNEVKETIYCFLKEKLSKKFPEIFPLNPKGATNKIFWANLKFEKPQRPFVELDEVYKSRLNKRFYPYYVNNIEYTLAQWRLTVKFEVRTVSNNGNPIEAEKTATEIIDFIEYLFTNSQETFDYFNAEEIVINELESSEIRDLSKFLYTNNEFVFSIDIPFEYEDLEERIVEEGQFVEININVDNSNNSIKEEIENK